MRSDARRHTGVTTGKRDAALVAEWLAAGALAALLAYQLASPDPRIGDDDFQVFYAGAAALAAGGSPYVGDFVSPPWFALALVPLTWLPLPMARAVWLGLNLGLLVLTTLGCTRLVDLRWPPRRVVLAAMLFGLWPPVAFGLQLGQSSLLVWALALGALLAARAHRWGRTGFMIGLGLVKPQLVALYAVGLAVAAARRGALGHYLAAALAVAGASALLVAVVAPAAYADLLALRPRTWNYWGSTVALPPLFAEGLGSETLGIAVYLPIALVGTVLLVRQWATAQPGALTYLAGLTACATLLLTPYAYPHDAVLLQLPVLWLVGQAACAGSGSRRLFTLGVLAACVLWLLERPGDYTAWRFVGLLPPLGVLVALVISHSRYPKAG